MNTEPAFAPLLDLLVKSAALILAGTALLAALRKTSAANRHAASVALFAALVRSLVESSGVRAQCARHVHRRHFRGSGARALHGGAVARCG